MLTFSVLICTYNRHELLQKALKTLIVDTDEKPDQVVVVNGGDQRADEVVSAFIGSHGIEVKLLKVVNKNLAANRNVGLGHCMGDILAMTDDDAEVFPDWVTQMKRVHHEHPEAGAVGGLVLGTNADSFVSKVADLITFPGWPEASYVRSLPGVNISYKRAVIDKVGLQDESLFRGEDVDFNWRVKQLGYEIYFDPAIQVWHHHRPTIKSLMNQKYMYGRAYYLVRKKWPEMYCIYPHKIRGIRDILKAAHSVLGAFYLPFIEARPLPKWWDRVAALPMIFFAGVVWRVGMLMEKGKALRQALSA